MWRLDVVTWCPACPRVIPALNGFGIYETMPAADLSRPRGEGRLTHPAALLGHVSHADGGRQALRQRCSAATGQHLEAAAGERACSRGGHHAGSACPVERHHSHLRPDSACSRVASRVACHFAERWGGADMCREVSVGRPVAFHIRTTSVSGSVRMGTEQQRVYIVARLGACGARAARRASPDSGYGSSRRGW